MSASDALSSSPETAADRLRIAVVIASRARPQHVGFLLARLGQQSRIPDCAVISVTEEADSPTAVVAAAPFETVVLTGPPGLTRQRNLGLNHSRSDFDLVAFFDDDYVPSLHAIKGICSAFAAFSEIGGLTGILLADGIRGPGLSSAEALALVQAADERHVPGPPQILREIRGLYGCNMAYRTRAVDGLHFDERLPLYGWQEDIDFSWQIRAETVQIAGLVGVHCGTKQGRELAGAKLGYSQIANPLYLVRKGTISGELALRHAVRNVIANHVKAFWSEPWVDRRGRARGNWQAIWDLARGRIDPERILDL